MSENTAYAKGLVSMGQGNHESPHGCVTLMVLSLQAFGLAVLMARAGLAVPVEGPVQVLAYSVVLADMRDEQSLSANLSTFSGHLRRIQVKPLLLLSHLYAPFLLYFLLLVLLSWLCNCKLCSPCDVS